ncbi:MAG: 2'-5' RNA ligase [Rhodobacteraceae bacterium]|uniref:RNA 2',3'-cyclic phosphodiesterase n=1 Tax=Cypionkella sp. TaxID=2811411 RepID=UPI0013232F47|nr:RNA 2',3'-cyclic phosphodiesterase [Cypionkella sp.]KAF0172104.1 MAG: 2'-5' RNA ligase [Paracoccaceae bacterium]MDO8326202.1 RNA 2',3'-cyclic phosphodiesterase [Cypionkella sp.]
MIRAFLALDLPEAQRAALRLQQFLLPLPRRVDPDNFHLTLLFLGEQPDVVLEALHDRLCDLRLRPFALTLQGFGLFGGARARAAWAGLAASEALNQLQAKCANAAALAGARVEARKFVPHVTLGRFPPPDPVDQMRLERGIAEGMGFRSGPFAVREFVMYESHLGPKGPRYEVLARYPL